MHEHRGAQSLRRLEHREQCRIVQVPAVDVGADLHAGELEFAHAALQFLHRQVGLCRGRVPSATKRFGSSATTAAR